jgi:hypothetical protein
MLTILRVGLLASIATAAVTPNDRVHDIPIPVSLSQANFDNLPHHRADRLRVTLHRGRPLQVFSAGSNQHGQLGVGDRLDRNVPWPLAYGPYSATVCQSRMPRNRSMTSN